MNIDDPFYDQLASAATKAGAGRIISFGRKDDAEFCLFEARALDGFSEVVSMETDESSKLLTKALFII